MRNITILLISILLFGCAGSLNREARIKEHSSDSFTINTSAKTREETIKKFEEGANRACNDQGYIVDNHVKQPIINKLGGGTTSGQTQMINGIPVYIPGGLPMAVIYGTETKIICKSSVVK